MTQPILGVMALYLNDRKIEELAYFRKLAVKAEKLGLDVIVFTPEDVHKEQKQIFALRYDSAKKGWSRKWSPFPDIVYDRCRFQRNYRFQLLRKFRSEHAGLLYMNRPMAHKWGVHQVLQKNRRIQPFLPDTLQYREPDDLTHFLQKYDLVYLKPIDGTGGRGILRIEHENDGLYLIQGRDRQRHIITPQKVSRQQIAAKLAGWELNRYLIQQGIDLLLKNGRVHDFRLLMQKDGRGEWTMTGCAGRIGPKGSITSNLHGGGAAVSMLQLLRSRFSPPKVAEITGSMERLGHEVVKQLEARYGQLCEMALDIAVDRTGHIWLLEVNPKPAREVFHRIKEFGTYEQAIAKPLEYALWLYKQKKPRTQSVLLRP